LSKYPHAVLNYGALGRAGKAEVTSGTISRDQ